MSDLGRMTQPRLVIEMATEPEQLQSVRVLMKQFVAWAVSEFHPNDDQQPNVFKDIEAELNALPGKYAGPDGALFIASLDGVVVGCLGGVPHGPTKIEASRLWVSANARGEGIGAKLVKHLMQFANTAGYKTIVLRTHKDMKPAHKIYADIGFTIGRNPVDFPDLSHFEVSMKMNL